MIGRGSAHVWYPQLSDRVNAPLIRGFDGLSSGHALPNGCFSRGSAHLSAARRRVLDAATELFARRGFAGTSMQDVADALGIRKPSLYKHFAGKDALYGAVLERALAPFATAIDAELLGTDAARGLDALPKTSLRMLHDNPNAALLLLQELVRVDHELHPFLAEWLDILFAKADAAFASAAEDVAPWSVEARLALLTVLNVVLGFFVTERLLPAHDMSREDLVSLETAILAAVLSTLRGKTTRRRWLL
jgi:AcrR family transcriptional regulator